MHALFLLHQGSNSRDIFLDLASGFRAAGHRVSHLPIEPLFGLVGLAKDRAALRASVASFVRELAVANGVDLIVAMWGNALLLLGGLEDDAPFPCPVLHVWLDSPERAHEGSLVARFGHPAFRRSDGIHLVNNEATAAECAQLFGFANVVPLPWGVDPDRFAPVPGGRPEFDLMVSFGGGDGGEPPTDAMLAALGEDDPPIARLRSAEAERLVRPRHARLLERVEPTSRDAVAAVLASLLATQLATRATPFPERLARLHRAGGPEREGVEHLAARPPLLVEAVAATREVEGFLRPFSAAWLARRFRVGSFGSPPHPAWGCAEGNLGFVAYQDQASCYARAACGLSVMRWQDEAGLHLKPFEITASGVACLAEERPGLDRLWKPGVEIATFRTLPEAARAIERLHEPAARAALAAAGRARTVESHTWAARVGLLVPLVERLTRRGPGSTQG